MVGTCCPLKTALPDSGANEGCFLPMVCLRPALRHTRVTVRCSTALPLTPRARAFYYTPYLSSFNTELQTRGLAFAKQRSFPASKIYLGLAGCDRLPEGDLLSWVLTRSLGIVDILRCRRASQLRSDEEQLSNAWRHEGRWWLGGPLTRCTYLVQIR